MVLAAPMAHRKVGDHDGAKSAVEQIDSGREDANIGIDAEDQDIIYL